jgi:hypothetical protein
VTRGKAVNTLLVLVPICCAAILFVFLVVRGYRTRDVRIKLPFVEIDTSKFQNLSPVRYFGNLSIIMISPKSDLRIFRENDKLLSTPPIVLVHIGWNIVCEAFITKFIAYPTDENIHSAASAIGGQNAEFIRMYRDIHKAAILVNSIKREFANNYLLRAPSLAERITGEPFPIQKNKFVNDFIEAAFHINSLSTKSQSSDRESASKLSTS